MERFDVSRYRVGGRSLPFLVALLAIPAVVVAQTTQQPESVLAFDEVATNPAPAAPAASNPPPVAVPTTSSSAIPIVPPDSAGRSPASVAERPPEMTPPLEPKRNWIRDGFYLRLLTISGFSNFHGDGPSGSARVSGLGSGSVIGIGAAVARGVTLAAMLQATQVSGKFKGGPYANTSFVTADQQSKALSHKATAGLAVIGAMVDWYPFETAGLHLGLGAGLAANSLILNADDTTLYATGFAGTLFAGYDWPIAPAWAMGLALVTSATTISTLKNTESSSQSASETGYKMGAFSIGVAGSILYF